MKFPAAPSVPNFMDNATDTTNRVTFPISDHSLYSLPWSEAMLLSLLATSQLLPHSPCIQLHPQQPITTHALSSIILSMTCFTCPLPFLAALTTLKCHCFFDHLCANACCIHNNPVYISSSYLHLSTSLILYHAST